MGRGNLRSSKIHVFEQSTLDFESVIESDESMHSTSLQPDPSPILQTAFAFWSSKVLLTAVDFDVFTKLGNRQITGASWFGLWCAKARSFQIA
jgi:hypothetical protein